MQTYAKYKNGEVGCDEAGRGCIAGPVVAAAVMLQPQNIHPLINDSKKLTKSQREEMFEWIQSNAQAFGIGVISVEQIDRENILQASISGMHQALSQLEQPIKHILVDGNQFRQYGEIPYTCIVKGDSKFAAIAAASILAKVYRDQIMETLHAVYPMFAWNKNKGYHSLSHRAKVLSYGPNEHHRQSFEIKRTAALLSYMQKKGIKLPPDRN